MYNATFESGLRQGIAISLAVLALKAGHEAHGSSVWITQVVGGKDKYRAVCRACFNHALDKKVALRRRQSIGVVRSAPHSILYTLHSSLPTVYPSV